MRAAYGKCMWPWWNPMWISESNSWDPWSTMLPGVGGLQGAFPWAFPYQPQDIGQPKRWPTVSRTCCLIPYSHAFGHGFLLGAHTFSSIPLPNEILLILQASTQVSPSPQSFFFSFLHWWYFTCPSIIAALCIRTACLQVCLLSGLEGGDCFISLYMK